MGENADINAIKERLAKFLTEGGAGEVGFCRLDKENVFNLSYAVSFDIPLSRAIVETIDGAPTHTYFHHYRTVNALIDNLALRAGRILAESGFDYVPIAASQSVNGMQGIFSHKYAAVKCGLGSVGKSGLFLSKKHGPCVRLGTILTDCALAETSFEPQDVCTGCDLCVKACPAMAITGEMWRPNDEREKIIDAKACSDHMKKAYQHIGRGAVCGICMSVCPIGKK